MANVVPPKHLMECIGENAKKYVNILKERAAAINETQNLKSQNDELKALLNQYLGADVNDGHIPPTQVIQLMVIKKKEKCSKRHINVIGDYLVLLVLQCNKCNCEL